MKRINKDIIGKIKDSLRISDVIGEYVSLQRSGANFKGVCPFHEDSNPSMFVSDAKGIFKCFACGASGDVFAFVQKYENVSFMEAAVILADKARIVLEDVDMSDDEMQKMRKVEGMKAAIKASHDYYTSNLMQSRTYLQSRGWDITDKTLAEYGVGYAPSGNDAKRTLTRQGWSEQVLVDVGVLAKSQTDGSTYDVFRDRLMFPFYDLSGHIIGYSGRMVTKREHAGKYVNTGETPLFHKGKTLFGLYQAKNAIVKLGFVYLVEGQFDVLSFHRYGIANVVGGSGTALTDEQVSLIRRFCDKVVMCYDSDGAGISASVKNCESMLRRGIKVYCYRIRDGKDPDEFAREYKEQTSRLLLEKRETFPHAFRRLLVPRGCKDEVVISESLDKISALVAIVEDHTLRVSYEKGMAEDYGIKFDAVHQKVSAIRAGIKTKDTEYEERLYGLEEFKSHVENDLPGIITSDMQDFLDRYDTDPIICITGELQGDDLLSIRKLYGYFVADEYGLKINEDGTGNFYLKSLVSMYKGGISKLYVLRGDNSVSFLDYYIDKYGEFLKTYTNGNRVDIIRECVALTSFADDAAITVNRTRYCNNLGLTKGQFDDLRKPFVQIRRSSMKANVQGDSLSGIDTEGDELPTYVIENPEYNEMWKQYGFFPRLNDKNEPVCYMFRNKDGNGLSIVGDFYMTPLLHIFNEDFEKNKRILRINRRWYATPIYIEIQSSALLKMSTIENVLINYEAINFSNGEEWKWKKIKEWMSRRYTLCSEIQVYGNQQRDGTSRKEDEQFFAFANGIAHFVGNDLVFDPINELGVVSHNGKNYYLPAFSTIYSGDGNESDKYETISQFVYRDVKKEREVTFSEWASLMNEVYKINDNGKWAIIFAVMCAFRSNIHCIDRLFTAPFFMGPMSSGKTQIAVSIRSLFISPYESIFNLNMGTDAAMLSYMSMFRDVPIVLDEYNNDITMTKFQALKSIVYDGDSKQKRKANSSKDIESDKVLAPVIICGQETPQRDDNALMSRVIICEVPKPKNRTKHEVEIFQRLKEIEDPRKVGLSNVLMRVLKLRPIVMDHYRSLRSDAYEDLKIGNTNQGEADRLTKTASLFLGMVKLIENYAPDMQLPFTYAEMLDIARRKIAFQLSLIRSTDKLAMFFSAINSMIDTGKVLYGRDFSIVESPKVTYKDAQGDARTLSVEPGHKVMFFRLSTIFNAYERNGYNSEKSSLSTIDQNFRSHPCYIGTTDSRRFSWEEIIESDDGFGKVVRTSVEKKTATSALVVDYEVFLSSYGIDFRRDADIPSEEACASSSDGCNDSGSAVVKPEQLPLPFDKSDIPDVF